MIESIVVIAIGFFLVWLSRTSRKVNKKIDSLSPKAKSNLIESINNNINPSHTDYLVGGSVTKVPKWVGLLVLIVFAIALYFGVKSVT
ncbi:hypothetical protein I6F65_20425 [Pseudoalteromonas sp. SWXJZ94C]|uniref:hypothetical protein n=1 Tax=Pseudoalteromonas sp. SWXJZ94C TaxID=2792065 RepID=UPI0018CE4F78|nr:hypothetical protein [Pseudoalteromonas sp. SWXJZ94C]MBH0059311.1 hypothetical protein [Pseudoalteromonas sp. SWXJZ94C]